MWVKNAEPVLEFFIKIHQWEDTDRKLWNTGYGIRSKLNFKSCILTSILRECRLIAEFLIVLSLLLWFVSPNILRKIHGKIWSEIWAKCYILKSVSLQKKVYCKAYDYLSILVSNYKSGKCCFSVMHFSMNFVCARMPKKSRNKFKPKWYIQNSKFLQKWL